MEYAIQLITPVILGMLGGLWLDKHHGTGPWGVLGGLLLGIVLGIGMLYKRAMIMMEEQKKHPLHLKPLSDEEEEDI